MSLARRFAASVFSISTASALASVCTLLIVIIATRVLASHQWGTFAALWGGAQAIAVVVNFGSATRVVRTASFLPLEDARAVYQDAASRRLGSSLTLLVVGAILVAVGQQHAGLMIAASGGVAANLLTPSFAISQRSYLKTAFLIVAERLALLLGTLALAVSGHLGVSSLLLTQVLSGMSAFSLGIAVSGCKLRPIFFRAFKRHFDETKHFGMASLGPSLFLLDAATVKAVANSTEAGLFGVASRCVGPLGLIATSVVNVILPEARSVRSVTLSKALTTLSIVMLGSAACFAPLLVYAPVWVPALFGQTYEGAVAAVQIYIAAAVIMVLTRSCGALLQGWNDEKFVALAVTSQGVVGLSGIALGAALGGATLAALLAFTTYLALAAVLIVRVVKLWRLPVSQA